MRIHALVILAGCWHGEPPAPVRPATAPTAVPDEDVLDQGGLRSIRGGERVDLETLASRLAPHTVRHDDIGNVVIDSSSTGIIVKLDDLPVGEPWLIEVRDPRVRTVAGTRVGTRWDDAPARDRPARCSGGPTEGDTTVWCSLHHLAFVFQTSSDQYGGGAFIEAPDEVLRGARLAMMSWERRADDDD